MGEELKKCPFCGADPDISVQEDDTEDTYYVVACTNCNMAHSSSDDEDVAIRNWNDRPIEDAQAARIAELEAERDRMREALEKIAQWDMLARSQKGLIAIIEVLKDTAREALAEAKRGGSGNERRI